MRLLHKESRGLINKIIKEEIVREYLRRERKHDNKTYGHSIRVGLLSVDLGHDILLNRQDLIVLGYSGLLHDIGKIKIPKQILSKKAPLNNTERYIIRRHPRLGFLELRGFIEKIGQIIVAHHEFKRNPYPRNEKDRRQKYRGNERRRYAVLT